MKNLMISGLLMLTMFASIVSSHAITFSAPKNTSENSPETVSKMPEFMGGKHEFSDYIRENLVYPVQARENLVEGTVYVSFTVDKDGTISNVKNENSLGFGLEEEAVRVVKQMPKWNPGQQNGANLTIKCVLPIKFQLLK